jgi:hypothetical protein
MQRRGLKGGKDMQRRGIRREGEGGAKGREGYAEKGKGG